MSQLLTSIRTQVSKTLALTEVFETARALPKDELKDRLNSGYFDKMMIGMIDDARQFALQALSADASNQDVFGAMNALRMAMEAVIASHDRLRQEFDAWAAMQVAQVVIAKARATASA